MNQKILVAFASDYGSTQEVAEKIAADLAECGLAVDLQLSRKIRRLDGYGGVVLGAPLYMFRWHRDALHFLKRFQKILANGFPVAIFAGGPIEAGKREQFQEVRGQLDKELAKFSWLRPVSIEIIGGKFDPSRLRLPWSLLPALKQMPYTDLRDWDAIHAWTESLPAKFQPA